MSSRPKVALVCDWLTTPGGAEKVLLRLHRMYPDAPIYTSQYRPRKIDWFRDADVRTGWINFFPAGLRRFIGIFRQWYFSHLDLSEFDVVISVTGAEAKSVKTQTKTKSAFHICYCHVPTQYYWSFYDKYLKDPGFGIFNPLARLGLRLLVKPLRQADYRAAQRPDRFVTISQYAAAQIKQYYGRSADVVHPPVDYQQFAPTGKQGKPRSGLIISCRQVTWKRVDLAITACLATQQPLTIVGDGPEHRNLEHLARDSELIKFLPWADTAQLASYLQSASAYIFPSLEPFGIAPVEALAAGCPVIAYADGGSRDIVIPGKNGLLFTKQTTASLATAIREFYDRPVKFDPATVARTAQRFSPEKFIAKIQRIVKEGELRQ